MSKTEGIFLVLHENIGHAEFLRLAEAQDWIKHQTREGDGQRISYQEIWTTPDQSDVINYVDDPLTLTRHLWIRGSRLAEVLARVVERLPIYESEELLEMADNAEDHDEAVQAIFRIAVAFPNFDPEAFNLFESYLKRTDKLLRKATVQAIAYRLWKESIPLLQQVADDDSDEEVRHFAQSTLSN